MGSLDDDTEPYSDLDLTPICVIVAIASLGAVVLGLSALYLLAQRLIGF